MGRIRNTIDLDRGVDVALRDWADRKGYSMSKTSNILLRHALFDSLDEGTQAQSGAGDAPSGARGGQAGDPGEHVPAAGGTDEPPVGRGRGVRPDAYVARKLARDVLDYSTGSEQWANDQEQDAWLAFRRRYTQEELKEAASEGR